MDNSGILFWPIQECAFVQIYWQNFCSVLSRNQGGEEDFLSVLLEYFFCIYLNVFTICSEAVELRLELQRKLPWKVIYL